jgi:opacity protein-like surface antigen
MKSNIFIFTLLNLYTIASCAGINAANGFYLGVDGVTFSSKAMNGAAFSSTINLGLNWDVRPYLGYRINDNFAVEGGYLDLINDKSNGGGQGIFGTLGPDHYRLYAFDFAGKVIYPYGNGFSVYSKAGVAYVHQNVFNKTYINNPPIVDSKVNKILPLIGCGISYNFTQRFATDLAFTYIQGISPINNITSLGWGLSYTFA